MYIYMRNLTVFILLALLSYIYYVHFFHSNEPLKREWSGGAMVLSKLPVPVRPTILIIVGQGPSALAVGAGGGCLDIFTLIYHFSFLSPSLWETARYRLKYCLKGPLSPKPTNQPNEPLKYFVCYIFMFCMFCFHLRGCALVTLQANCYVETLH